MWTASVGLGGGGGSDWCMLGVGINWGAGDRVYS